MGKLTQTSTADETVVATIGEARVFSCLQANIAKSGFGDQCKQQVQDRENLMQQDYRLDYGVSSQCEADVNQYCSLEKVSCALLTVLVLPGLPNYAMKGLLR